MGRRTSRLDQNDPAQPWRADRLLQARRTDHRQGNAPRKSQGLTTAQGDPRSPERRCSHEELARPDKSGARIGGGDRGGVDRVCPARLQGRVPDQDALHEALELAEALPG